IGITRLSPALSWAKDGRLLFVYFEQAGYNIYAVDDPRRLDRVAVADLPTAAAPAPLAGNITTPAAPTAQDRRLEPDSTRTRGFIASYYREGEDFRPSARLPDTPVSEGDRKSTRLNSSHVKSSYAVFCLKKKM